MLSATDLTTMRAAQTAALPDTCIRTRVTLVSDSAGGYTEMPTTFPYACRVAPTSGRELEIAARVTSERTLTVTLPHDANVLASDRLAVGDRTLQVVAALEGGAWQTALRVLVVEA